MEGVRVAVAKVAEKEEEERGVEVAEAGGRRVIGSDVESVGCEETEGGKEVASNEKGLTRK